MTTKTVNLVVRVPDSLRKRAKAIAHLRGETVSDVVRQALQEYVAEGEHEAASVLSGDRLDALDDEAYARAILDRIARGERTFSHEEVWEELDRLESEGGVSG